MPAPTTEELDDVLLSARFGEADNIKTFGETYGWEVLAGARDERGNSALHMACGNGHLDVIMVLIEHLPADALKATNEAGSPALHWAVINNHVACVQALVAVPEEQGGGVQLLKQKNGAGRDAFDEAVFAGEGKEEVAGWIEGYVWKAEGADDSAEDYKISVGETEEDVVAEADAQGVEDVTTKAEGLAVKDQEKEKDA